MKFSLSIDTAIGILSEALQEGDYDTVVEASSGNTAGAVALVANRLGLACKLTCPEGTSPDKIGYMKAVGAEVRECPDVELDHPDHYRAVARCLAEEAGAFLVDQYHNPSNPQVHCRWTGPEIWVQAGDRMTHLVCAMGTRGLLSGSARYLKERAREEECDVRGVGVDAERSNISTAFRQARDSAQTHGFPIGPSAGAALSVRFDICARCPEARVVTLISDRGNTDLNSKCRSTHSSEWDSRSRSVQ